MRNYRYRSQYPCALCQPICTMPVAVQVVPTSSLIMLTVMMVLILRLIPSTFPLPEAPRSHPLRPRSPALPLLRPRPPVEVTTSGAGHFLGTVTSSPLLQSHYPVLHSSQLPDSGDERELPNPRLAPAFGTEAVPEAPASVNARYFASFSANARSLASASARRFASFSADARSSMNFSFSAALLARSSANGFAVFSS